MQIRPASRDHLGAWSEMRYALWAWDSPADHAREAATMYLAGLADHIAYLAFSDDGQAVGFAEGGLRRDYVEGCDTSPVAYLEGIYVRPEARKQGVARALADAIGEWGRAKGCTEFASDALLDNLDSHAFHSAIGFAEAGRVVYFKRAL